MNTPRNRIDSVDALRGIVMVLMTLDHVREFFHSGALSFSPEDLTRTTPALFFTRWITHLCAPVFMFTAGISVFLVLRRSGGRSYVAQHLRRRGFWLILLDIIVVRLAFTFSLDKGVILLTVLWALGCSMIVLSGLIYVPIRALVGCSVAVVVLHNLLDGVAAEDFGPLAWIWNILHQPGAFPASYPIFLAAYPLVPWFAVMALGYCFGRVFTMQPDLRRLWMVRVGAAATLAFFILRAVNIYGDPSVWSRQPSSVLTVLSFLRVTKYPPSLDFLLITLGPALLLAAVLDRRHFSALNPILVFGRVPLFYFLVHLFAIHALAVGLAYLRFGHAGFLFGPLPSMGGSRQSYPADYGYDLWVIYLIWITVVVALYPLCRWFDSVKAARRYEWLRYF